MASLEELIEQSIREGVYSGCAIASKGKSGQLSYAHACGKIGIDGDAPNYSLDTVLQIASMTKLITTIAVLQLVEMGEIGLDDNVDKYIPELTSQGVLKAVEESGKPVTEPIKDKLTLRHLLTHSAGCTYDVWDARIQKIKKYQGKPRQGGLTFAEWCTYPLLYQPGMSWTYGTSIDWAGRVLERLTGLTLEEYLTKNVWPQLGVKDFTFFISQRADMKKRLAQMTERSDDGNGVQAFRKPFLNERSKDCFGGHGGYCTVREYIKVLESLLEDDEKLLKRETTRLMFEPQLTPASKKALVDSLNIPEVAATFIGDFPEPDQYDWGLGGILVGEANQKRRGKNTLIWSGMPNCFWFIDRERGLCGVFGTQVLPPGDAKVGETIKKMEYTLNDKVSKL